MAIILPDPEQLEKFAQAYYSAYEYWITPQWCLAELWNLYTE